MSTLNIRREGSIDSLILSSTGIVLDGHSLSSFQNADQARLRRRSCVGKKPLAIDRPFLVEVLVGNQMLFLDINYVDTLFTAASYKLVKLSLFHFGFLVLPKTLKSHQN